MITDADFRAAAEKLGCSIAAIKAVAEVESAGGGFLPSGQPKILFEAHLFSRLTDGRYDVSHPHLSSARWNRKLYRGGEAEHERLAEAVALDRDAALQSASWGRFQILGSNYARCGYPTLQAFINAMYRDEAAHLEAFVGFVQSSRLADELQRLDWAGFARVYNGPAFAANRYDTKMAAAYARFAAKE